MKVETEAIGGKFRRRNSVCARNLTFYWWKGGGPGATSRRDGKIVEFRRATIVITTSFGKLRILFRLETVGNRVNTC